MNKINEVYEDASMYEESPYFKKFYGRYLPFAVVERFTETEEGPARPLLGPEISRYPAAVAFVDISGFTKLSESLVAKYGLDGAEMLNKYISGYFEELITVILEHGGDIIKFAGDAMLVVWKSNTYTKTSKLKSTVRKNLKLSKMLGDSGKDPLYLHILRAVACSLNLMEKLNNFKVTEDITLTLHSGIGAGNLSSCFVGGVDSVWEYFVAGRPIQEMSVASDEAKNGEVYLSPNSYTLIEQYIKEAKKSASGNYLVTSLMDAPQCDPSCLPVISRGMETFLLSFIPPLIRTRVESGNGAEWSAEYRRAYIMFVKLPGLEYSSPDVVERLQNAVCNIQESVSFYEGYIARLLADDKGTRFKIVFGMPGLVHEDDGVRAVLTALDIEKRLSPINMQPIIGIAHGPVFCGEAGSSIRSEYTAVGFKVNMAARLMSAAEQRSKGIFVDEKTFEAAVTQSINFERYHERIPLKNVSEPVEVFIPLGKIKTHNLEKSSKIFGIDQGKSAFMHSKNYKIGSRKFSILLRRPSFVAKNLGLIGREVETNLIQSLLAEVAQTSQSKVVIIEGDSGIGKSALVLESMLQTEKSRVQCRQCFSHGILLQKSTAYGVWKDVLKQAIQIEDTRDKKMIQLEIKKHLDSSFSPMAALVNDIFDLEFEENGFLRQMTTDGRAQNTRKLLVHLVTNLAKSTLLMIVIEDMQWADSASWALAFDIFASVPNIFVLLSTRSLPKPYPIEFVNIVKLPKTHRIPLRPLTKDQTVRLARAKLDVRSLPPSLSEMLFVKTQGHPLYIEELLQTMLDEHLVSSVKNECIVSEKLTREGIQALPDSLNEVVTSRIDRLPVDLQLTIKVSSVIGSDVSFNVLRAIHPKRPADSELGKELSSLVDAGFFMKPGSSSELVDTIFTFCSNLFHEVAYKLLLLQHRQQLHKQTLEYLERTTEDSSQIYDVLTHHAVNADLHYKALEYAEKAGMHATSGNATDEAVRFFNTALDMHNKLGIIDAIRLETCHVNLAEAYYSLGRYDESINHYLMALDLNGNPIPHTEFQLRQHLFSMATRQYWREKFGMKPRYTKNKEPASTYRASRILEKAAQAAMLNGDSSLSGYCAFKLVDLCETVEDQGPLLVVGYSLCGYISMVLQKTDLAELYNQKAMTIVQNFPHLPEMDKAMAKMQVGMYTASHGQWEEALSHFARAKRSFKRYGERKKWRECTLMIGVILHMQCKFSDCQKHFSKLIRFAEEDGDLYLHASALFWHCLTELVVHGASMKIDNALEKAKSIHRETHRSSIALQITTMYNAFHVSQMGSTEELETVDDSSKSIDMDEMLSEVNVQQTRELKVLSSTESDPIEEVWKFAEEVSKELTESANLLWYNVYKYVHFLQLIFDAVEQLPDSRKKLRRKLSRHAEDVVQSLQKSFPFPYAKCYRRYLKGRLDWITNKDRAAFRHWIKAAKTSSALEMRYIVALASFQTGKNSDGNMRQVNLGVTKQVLEECGISYHQHSQFKGLDEMLDVKNDEKVPVSKLSEVEVFEHNDLTIPKPRKPSLIDTAVHLTSRGALRKLSTYSPSRNRTSPKKSSSFSLDSP